MSAPRSFGVKSARTMVLAFDATGALMLINATPSLLTSNCQPTQASV